MLRTLLLWHLTATAAMLAVYVLVAGLQWSAAHLSGSVATLRRRAARRLPVSGSVSVAAAGAVARHEGEAGAVPLTSAA